MEAYGSNGYSWADQWDYSNPEPVPENKRNGSVAKFRRKASDKLDKTKAVASTGMKKVKEGASGGIQWIKVKCHKTTQKHSWDFLTVLLGFDL
ncbi:hypothetical protein F0562_033385 [Nyssa sinensis]|uniref:Uncharacterized protein n=1 Tax=Nyssa sinensis TaxID=561372 RepID=A0A5J5ATQ8_9ASTE|nr:hypothetical protein F0562_033385 [Nyssa sinensis]